MSETDNPARNDRGGLFSRIARGFLPLMSGSGAGQLLLFAVYPVISRLYTTADFGLLAVFTAISMPLTVIASLKYELAIPGAENHRESEALVTACALITLLITLVSFCLLSLAYLAEPVRKIFSETYFFVLLVSIAVFAGGVMRWLNYWYVRHRAFRVIAVGNITHAAAMAVIQVFAGALFMGPWGLLVSQFVAPASAVLLMILWAGHKGAEFNRASIDGMLAVIRRYKTFSIYGASYAFINAIAQHLPGFILAGLLGLGPAGIFLMAQRILKHPADLTGEAIRQAAFPELVEAARQKNLTNAMMRITAALALVTMPVLIIIVIFGPELFAIIFGKQWRESGVLAIYLIFYAASAFIIVPATVVIQILEVQRLHMLMEGLVLVLGTASIILGAMVSGLVMATALFSLVATAVNILVIGMTAAYARTHDRSAA